MKWLRCFLYALANSDWNLIYGEKMKKIICGLVLFGTSASYAGAMGPIKSDNEYMYIGLAGGYGRIENNTPPLLDSILGYSNNTGLLSNVLSTLANIALNPTRDVGGFSGRAYTGYVFSANDKLSIGPEFGFSGYANTKQGESLPDISSILSAAGAKASVYYSSQVKTKGYGFDLLLNGSYSPSERGLLYLKPGFQLAHEQTSVNTAFNLNITSIKVPINLSNSHTTNKFAPEVIIGGSWQVTQKHPLFIGTSYQYVFNTADNRGYNQVSSRDMLTLNVEYHV